MTKEEAQLICTALQGMVGFPIAVVPVCRGNTQKIERYAISGEGLVGGRHESVRIDYAWQWLEIQQQPIMQTLQQLGQMLAQVMAALGQQPAQQAKAKILLASGFPRN